MEGKTTTAAPPRAGVLGRRERSALALHLAFARRQGRLELVAPWVLGYLQSIVHSGIDDAQTAECVRGLVDAWEARQPAGGDRP